MIVVESVTSVDSAAAAETPEPPLAGYRTKEERVADFLREGIISGRFPRGTRLKQVNIAKMLDISVTPVREALKLLEAEGYVTANSHRGSIVAHFDPATSEEILTLRVMLESHLVTKAMERMTSSVIGEVKILASQFTAAIASGERSRAQAINYRLHHTIYGAAQMPQTLHFVQVLWARYPFDLISAVPGRSRHAAEEHEELVRAITSGDISGAILATRRHIETGWATAQSAISSAANTPKG